jgi:hypothetical protein
MIKRLAVAGVAAFALAGFAIPAASAQGDPGTFTITVDKAAYTNQFKTAITVTGTYTCSPNFGEGGFDPASPIDSSLNINVSQIQGKGVIVSGGNGFGGLVCDGTTQTWAMTDVWANFGSGMGGGMPATWKGGRATVNANGGASQGDCMNNECIGIGASVDKVLQIH